jgi:hypothetical protein
MILASRVQAQVMNLAAWAEANAKLFLTAVDDVATYNPSSTTDTVALLKLNNYFRTAAFYHSGAATDYLDAALMSKQFTKPAGSETWANQTLSGVTSDPLAEGAAAALFAKNGDSFEPFRNVTITQNGKTSGGEWIDVIRFRDWQAEQIKINVFTLMVNSRIPYTDPGIRAIGSMIQQALDLGRSRGGIAPEELDDQNRVIPSYTITLPRSVDIPFNDKANRILNDVRFTARLAGAIHVVNINGTLSYTL